MRRLFPIFLLLSLGAFPTSAKAQKLESFKHQLAFPSTFGGGRVTTTEYGDAAEAVTQAERIQPRTTFRGYRICIFLDNSQNARSEAMRAKSLFEENFSNTSVYLTYDNPYWRVTVGNCLTTEEAIILKGRVTPLFPKAFIKNEELTLHNLLQ